MQIIWKIAWDWGEILPESQAEKRLPTVHITMIMTTIQKVTPTGAPAQKKRLRRRRAVMEMDAMARTKTNTCENNELGV